MLQAHSSRLGNPSSFPKRIAQRRMMHFGWAAQCGEAGEKKVTDIDHEFLKATDAVQEQLSILNCGGFSFGKYNEERVEKVWCCLIFLQCAKMR